MRIHSYTHCLKLSNGILPSLPAELVFALSSQSSLFFLHPGGLYQETYIRVKRHNPQRSRNRKHVENREESVTSVPPEVLGSIGVEFYLVSQTPKDRQDLSRTSAGPRRTVIFLQGRVKDQR